MAVPAAKRAALDFMEAMNRGDITTALGRLANDATWTLYGETPFGGPHAGRDAIAGALMGLGSEFYVPGSMSLEVANVVADDSIAAVEAIIRANIAGDGRASEGRYCLVFEVAEGSIKAVREYTDTARLLRSVGETSAEPSGSSA